MRKILILTFLLTSFNVNAFERYTIADVVDKVQPSVVNIIAAEKITTENATQVNPFAKNSKANNKKLYDNDDKTKENVNIGSGVIISKDGLLITNYHVIELATKIKVTTEKNKVYYAKTIGFDVKSDLALLQMETNGDVLPFSNFADSNKLRVGEFVIAVGNPYGLGGSVSTGIISARNRNIGTNIYEDFLQTDASINPGNSGGPLFNLDGDIVGINTAIFSKNGGSDGIGFAIPSNTVNLIIDQLKTEGKVTRGWLGIEAKNIDDEEAKALNLDSTNGVLVSSVTLNSPAYIAGIKEGDVILEYNSQKIVSLYDLPKMVAKTAINTDAKIIILRDGKKLELTAKIISTDSASELPTDGVVVKQTKVLGFYIANLTEDVKKELLIKEESGVIVTDVDIDYKKFNLKKGDVILQINQKDVNSVKDVLNIINNSDKKKSLLLLINRDEENIFSVIQR